MTSSSTPTAYAVSPDSGEHWSAEGAWLVSEGLYRIPLPLPMDGLRAVNVYVLLTDEGLTLIDGGWAIPVARELLDRCLRSIGAGFGDIRQFLVTHAHRDHYTMASVLAHELGAGLALGRGEKSTLDLLDDGGGFSDEPFGRALRTAGAVEVAEQWEALDRGDRREPTHWLPPTTWLDDGMRLPVAGRELDAVHTPGHTPGHFVFADRGAGQLFAGDHVLPTITPSIGFSAPVPIDPLGDFMASLTKVRGLPDLQLLPAHGPIAPSTHARVDELLAHHEVRLAESLAGTMVAGSDSESTALDVARTLGWTRHQHAFDSLDSFNQGMAAMETKAHLELLVVRGDVVATTSADGVRGYRRAR